MVRIYSKKAFQFGPGANRLTGEIDCFVTVPNSFQDMPERFTSDPMFILAKKCGDVSVINTHRDEVEAEVEHVDTHVDTVDPVAKYKEKLQTMNREETFAEGTKLEVEPIEGEKLGQYKKRIYEAYKLTVENN